MPSYLYRCPTCNKQEEITHSMKEIDEPSEELQLQTSCNENTCDFTSEMDPHVKWERVPQPIAFDSFSLMSTEQKQAKFAKRSADHSKKEGYDEQNREHTKSIRKDFMS